MAGGEQRHSFGCPKRRLPTNLRFADDVLLFSTSLSKLKDMLRQDFKRSTEKVGLEIHPDKTKMFSSQDKSRQKEVSIDNIKVEVLQQKTRAQSTSDKITFEQQETAEIKNILRAALAAFHKYRQELTSRSYRLCYRMRMFNMVITSTLTYASGTWTLSKEHERLIRSAQRKLPRLIVQSKRRYKIKAGKEQNIDEEPKKDEDYAEDKEGQRQTQIVTKTVTFHSRKTSTKKSTDGN